MGTLLSLEKPPPVVLVPPIFHRPDLAYRYRMTESSYDVLFGKVVRKTLFADYNGQADEFIARIMLKPPEDPNVDITATFSARSNKNIKDYNGETRFRWQRNAKDSNNFIEVSMSTLTKSLKLQSCAFQPALGFGAFSSFSILPLSRFLSKGENHFGFRYGSSNLSIGTIMDVAAEEFSCVWFVGKLGKITAGCQCKPKPRQSPGEARKKYFADDFGDPKNWSFAVDYGQGRSGPLNTSYNCCLEIQENSKLIASYYHHLVVQRQVKNPFEGSEVVAITNYLDIGFEFEQSLGECDSSLGKADSQQSAMQIGASWQANKNILVKAKLGSLSAGVALLFKSWWQPSFTLSFTAVRDYMQKDSKIGLGLQVENFGGASYERADPNYVMVTPTKKHLAEGMLKDGHARPMLNKSKIPAEFCPRDTIL